MSAETYPLAGIEPHISRRNFKEPYRVEVPEVKFSAELGRICEQIALRSWSGDLQLTTKQWVEMRKLRQGLVGKIAPAWKRGVFYVQDMNSEISRVLQSGEWSSYYKLLQRLDRYCHTSLADETMDLVNEKPLNRDKFRYIFLAAMAISRELVYPTFSINPERYCRNNHYPTRLPGQIFPNVTYNINGQMAGLFDAVLVPQGLLRPEEKFDLLDYIETGLPWNFIEVKTPFRPRRVTHYWSRQQPYINDTDQLTHRLGEMISYWEQMHNNPHSLALNDIKYNDPRYKLFPLPDQGIFCYLRGVLPTGIIYLNTKGYSFLNSWLRKVQYACHPVDYLSEEENNLYDNGEYERRMQENEQAGGDYSWLDFPLWALTQIARDRRDQLNNGGDSEMNPITGTMVPLDGLEVQAIKVPTKKKLPKRVKSRPTSKQGSLF